TTPAATSIRGGSVSCSSFILHPSYFLLRSHHPPHPFNLLNLRAPILQPLASLQNLHRQINALIGEHFRRQERPGRQIRRRILDLLRVHRRNRRVEQIIDELVSQLDVPRRHRNHHAVEPQHRPARRHNRLHSCSISL